MPIKNLIQFRRGSDWSSNPTLSSGEPGFDIAQNVLKIGDGSTAWSALKEIGSFAELYSGDLDGAVVVECKNSTGATIPAGTPVYVSGYYSTNGKALISIAKANDSSKMPAIGLLESELANDTEGYVHCFGLADQLDSSSFSVGNTVYVHPTGGLTNTRPTGINELVQNIGRVLRSDASQGRILILGPGRTNDVPNSGSFSILSIKDAFTFPTTDGTANQVLQTDGEGTLSFTGAPTFTALTVDTNTLYVDPTNNRIGIGTTSPAYQVEIENSGANALLVLDRTDGAATFIEGGATASVLGSVGANNVNIAYNSTPVVSIGASGAITVNNNFTFPTTDGSANQVLQTDGSGTLSFATASGGGVTEATAIEYAIALG